MLKGLKQRKESVENETGDHPGFYHNPEAAECD